MKRTIRILVAVGLLLLVAAASIVIYVVNFVGDEGVTPLERWIGRQLHAVAAGHLNAELDFEDPDYQYPATIVVQNIRLTVADPVKPGATLDILRIAKATLTVADIPQEGQPLHIERIVLEQPEFSLVSTSAENPVPVGFSNLVKTAAPTDAPAPPTDPAASSAKITDVFRIRLVHLINGKVHYDPREADGRAMTLDRINIVLNVEPDADGWYKLNTRIDRAPVSEMSVAGRFNLNTNAAQLDHLNLAIQLGDENNRSLPPQMQRALADQELRGKLTASIKGNIRFDDWRNADLALEAGLDDGNVSFGDYNIALPRVRLDAAFAAQRLDVNRLEADLLKGAISGNGSLHLSDQPHAELRLRGDDLHIHRVLKAAADRPDAAQELPFRGIAGFQIAARAPLDRITTRLNGSGNVTVREGRFLNVPALNAFEDGLAGVIAGNDIRRRNAGANDSLMLLYNFKNDRMVIDRLDYRSTIVAARGKGHMLLDGLKLDVIVNGGPIEKLQSILGPVGDLTALVTDRIAKYHLTGTPARPQVKAIVAEGLIDKIFGK